MVRRMDRRRFLGLSVIAVNVLPLGVACTTDEALEAETIPEDVSFFPQSVASGDPKPNSVICWTRVIDPARPGEQLEVELQLATSPGFADETRVPLAAAAARLIAKPDSDFTLRVRVDGLEPYTIYYYRFVYRSHSGVFSSRIGRTKTAPLPDSDTAVRFAVVSCQDYGGKYYHCYRHMVERDLDFFVHLGDYIYETVGDPTFQSDSGREPTFQDTAGALTLGDYSAARSVDNYRDLYRTYRSDPDLQRAHESFPIIAVYDDHEFSDDAHGATATYTDGAQDETDFERRANADRVWFEYMPVDYESQTASAFDASREFPDTLRIYRDLRFGKHLHLILADQRRYRSDHLVPEDAFPGGIFLDRDALTMQYGAVPADAVPYVDIGTYASGAYQQLLQTNAAALAIRPDAVTGLVSAGWINEQLATLGALPNPPALPASIALDDPALPRGYAYHQLNKSAQYSSLGSRYFVRQRPFEALAAARYAASNGASEDALGETQRQWFYETFEASTATWKLWGSQYTVMPRSLDLTPITIAPPNLQDRFNITAEDWDGMPNRRRELLDRLGAVPNVVIMTGDLHAFFAGAPRSTDTARGVVEFVCGSVSSTTWGDAVLTVLKESLGDDPNLVSLALLLGQLLRTDANPHLAFHNIDENGYATAEVTADRFAVQLHQIATSKVKVPFADLGGSINEHFVTTAFHVTAGQAALYRERDARAERWDAVKGQWTS